MHTVFDVVFLEAFNWKHQVIEVWHAVKITRSKSHSFQSIIEAYPKKCHVPHNQTNKGDSWVL